MGKLTLHSVYERFRSDMFLSSLTESGAAPCFGRVPRMLTSGYSDCTPDGYVRGQGLARSCDPGHLGCAQ